MDNEYQAGYLAHDRGEPFNASKSKAWQNGWNHAEKDDRMVTGDNDGDDDDNDRGDGGSDE